MDVVSLFAPSMHAHEETDKIIVSQFDSWPLTTPFGLSQEVLLSLNPKP